MNVKKIFLICTKVCCISNFCWNFNRSEIFNRYLFAVLRSLPIVPVKQRCPDFFPSRLENRWLNGSSFACNIQMNLWSGRFRYCSIITIRPPLIQVLTLVPSHPIAINELKETPLSSVYFAMISKMLRDLPFTGVKCLIYFPPGFNSRKYVIQSPSSWKTCFLPSR